MPVDPLAAALEPPTPGLLVRFGRFLPGVATTAEQIERFAAHWRDQVPEALAADGPVLVALGDSLAQGIGASSAETGYVGLLRQRLAVDEIPPPVLNLSRSGATIADVLEIQLPALTASGVTPGLVVCTVGSNDLVRSVRFRRTGRALRQLIDLLPPQAVLATLPAKGSLAATAMNRRLRSEAALRGVAVADVAARLTTWRGNQAGDRFHPNDSGYRIWLDAFVAAGCNPITDLGGTVDDRPPAASRLEGPPTPTRPGAGGCRPPDRSAPRTPARERHGP